jgi:hypothetical protein
MVERRLPLQDESLRQKVIQYVLERKCMSGGFCFYRLEEPNGSDTWFALSVFDLLHYGFRDESTVNYLRAMQHPDGSYDSIYSAFYSIKSLSLLGADPAEDPRPYISRNLGTYRFDARRPPAEVISLFKRTSFLVDLYKTTGLDAGNDGMIEFILRFRNEDDGFGRPRSTLHETSRALEMLQRLGYALDGLGAESFILRCETPVTGFTDIPRTSLGFLEHVHAGVLASHLLARRPRYAKQCTAFVLNCQNRNGGFSRTPHGGIATMEDTWYAAHALHLLTCGQQRPGFLTGPAHSRKIDLSDFQEHAPHDRTIEKNRHPGPLRADAHPLYR